MILLLLDFLIFISAAWLAHHLLSVRLKFTLEPLKATRIYSLGPFPRLNPYLSWLRRKMMTARWRFEPRELLWVQFFCGAGLMTAGTLGLVVLQGSLPDPSAVLFYLLFFFILGFALPVMKLTGAVQSRQKNMVKDFSFYLDLMVLGVEAGLDYLTVLRKILPNSRKSPLKEELETMLRQNQMGRSRSDAWREFSSRIDLPEIYSVILAFIQTDQTGSPLAKTLRHLSDEMKTTRFQLAEKRAYQMPVKMLIPLLGCIFPAVFILLFEPLILRFLRLL
ncbi:MAG: type II secretion system F family protein [Nitrospiria bacterium]